ncbi:hypothetical protein TWF730_010757 [Orbilia blumenaviensis]|uniref:Uncharacterized protein n=1 Tax=Orbilia blumenaviensis TaxID=1796055 RepID=A0AAV9USK8_9PEZI
MDSLKSIAKGGWHPDKKSSSSSNYSSSSRSGENERFKNFKGLQQVANWTGHGTKSGSQDPSTTTTRPLTSLKDPYSFGAPPKRDPKAPLPPPTQASVLTNEPVPVTPEPPVQEDEPLQPRGFQVNTTGISTSGLPAPPKRVLGTTSNSSPLSSSRPSPPLPSRSQPPPLPGRQPSNSVNAQEKPSTFPNITGPGITPSTLAASKRLGQAGVSVPGLAIGSESPSLPARGVPTLPSRGASQTSSHSIGELSGRFSSLKTPSTSSATLPAEASSGGTTWAQKQAALKTISQARNDPKTVSFSDAAAAAKTADNFRQRHGDQVAKGYRQAEAAGLVDFARNGPGEHDTPKGSPQSKWGDASSRISKVGSVYAPGVPNTSQGSAGPPALASIAGKKKPPPPPKPKGLETMNSPPPPPIPLGTKPK